MGASMSANSPDTSSQEWQLDCLARHILNMPTKPDRIAFVESIRSKMAKKAWPGAEEAADTFAADLRRRILEQHELRKAARTQAP